MLRSGNCGPDGQTPSLGAPPTMRAIFCRGSIRAGVRTPLGGGGPARAPVPQHLSGPQSTRLQVGDKWPQLSGLFQGWDELEGGSDSPWKTG